MSGLRLFSLPLVACLLAACSTPPSQPASGDKALEIEVVDARDMEAATGIATDYRFASFPLIQGAMAGVTTSDPVLYLPVRFGYASQLPLAELARRVAPLARPATEQLRADGLSIEPADTRLARVGSFFVRRPEDRIDLGAGFLDDVSRETLFLVYFDRPCRVEGTVVSGTVEIRVRASIAAAGLHWLRVRKDDATHWRLVPDLTQAPVALVTNGEI